MDPRNGFYDEDKDIVILEVDILNMFYESN
jgi:hypothetical protein